MASSKASQNVRNLMYPGKNALLPPKIPFPSVSASHTEYVPGGLSGSEAVQKLREGTAHHQRTSSESLLLEEQPFWLDDLLNEPESPIRKNGHRRSSSDSFTFVEVANAANIDSAVQNDYRFRNIVSLPPRGIQGKDARDTFCSGGNLLRQKNRPLDSLVATGAHPSYLPSARDDLVRQNSGPSYILQEVERVSSSAGETKSLAESVSQDQANVSPDKRGSTNSKPATSDTDGTKRAKQQFAQRSRVRKLQYIAELERNVQALQAEGSEFSAELEFLNQQNLILRMESKALKQRLESLAQEKLIKHMEQEVLEREIARLRALYKQQQQQDQQQQPHRSSSNHRRATSKDLDSQFANLSLKHKDPNSTHDSMTG